jgi:putative chitinase
MKLTVDQLVAISPGTPRARAATFIDFLNYYMPLAGIDTPIEVASFLAQVLHESGGLKWLREIWGPTPAQIRYERDFREPWPERTRGKRNWLSTQLGNSVKGDGKLMMGRGLIMTTGRFNYNRMSKEIFGDDRLLRNPELLATPQYAVQSAAIYWQWRKIDQHDDDKDIRKETLLVNGGYNGMADRQQYFDRACKVLGV